MLINMIDSLGIVSFKQSLNDWAYASIDARNRKVHSFKMINSGLIVVLYTNAVVETITSNKSNKEQRRLLRLPVVINQETVFEKIVVDRTG